MTSAPGNPPETDADAHAIGEERATTARAAPVSRRFCGRLRLWRLGLCVGSLACTLLVLEGLLRAGYVLGIATTDDAPPGESKAVDYGRNALGIREPWEQVPDGDGLVRIAFLGDSFTFGYGVEAEQAFVHLLEGMLNDSEGRRFVTINVGQPGTDTAAQVRRYRRLKDTLRPHVLVHVLYCNDLGHDLQEELRVIHALLRERSPMAQHSCLWRFVEGRLRALRVRRRTLSYFRGGDSPLKRERGWSHLRTGVEKVLAMAREDGTAYLLVLFPWLYTLDDYPLDDVHRRMARLAADLGVPFLDLLDAFRDRDARDVRISATDEHPNPEGHRLAADALARFLRAEGHAD